MNSLCVILTPSGWKINPTGFTHNNTLHPRSVWAKWTDEDLATIGAYRLEMPEAPEGKRLASYTIEGDETPVIVPVWEDLPPEPVMRRIVLKRVIVQRLIEDGFAEAAEMALSAAPVELRLLWNNLNDGPFSDDPDTINLLTSIGADPERILAPHEEDILVPVYEDAEA